MADLLGEFFPSKYLRGLDIPEGGRRAVIDRLVPDEVGPERQRVPLLHLRGLRPLILDYENAANLAAFLRTVDYRKYPGRSIVLQRRVHETDEGERIVEVWIDPRRDH
jgi:hypothetical protein